MNNPNSWSPDTTVIRWCERNWLTCVLVAFLVLWIFEWGYVAYFFGIPVTGVRECDLAEFREPPQ